MSSIAADGRCSARTFDTWMKKGEGNRGERAGSPSDIAEDNGFGPQEPRDGRPVIGKVDFGP